MRLRGLSLVAAIMVAFAATTSFADWEVMTTPNPGSGGDARLADIDGIADDDVWAVGAYLDDSEAPVDLDYKALILHWDGSEWTQFDAPHPSPYEGAGECRLEAVAAIAEDDVWFAGYQIGASEGPNVDIGPQLFILHWDGSELATMDTPSTPSQTSGAFVRDIEVIASDDIYFVGTWLSMNGGMVLHWDGDSFSMDFAQDESGRDSHFEAIDAVSGSDMWAVGREQFLGGGTDYSSIFHYDGESWTHTPGPTPGYTQVLSDVLAISADDVWALGYYTDLVGNSIAYKTLLLHWDGSDWTQIDDPVDGVCMLGVATDDVYIGGLDISHYDGSEWSTGYTVNDDVTNGAVVAMALTQGGDLFGAGYAWTGGGGFDTVVVRNVDAVTPTESLPLFLRGDVDGNGAVSALGDALSLLRWGFSGGTAPPCDQAADVDGNDELAVLTDTLSLLRWGFAGGTAPPAPGAETCGSDADTTLPCEVEADACANP